MAMLQMSVFYSSPFCFQNLNAPKNCFSWSSNSQLNTHLNYHVLGPLFGIVTTIYGIISITVLALT